MKTVEVKNLSFSYDKKYKSPVLSKVDFLCEPSTVNILIGLNGSGKSTLIKILAGLIENYSGEVFLNGKNQKDLSVKERAQIISYVSQQQKSAEEFSVMEYLLFSKAAKLKFYESPTKKDDESVLKCAEKLGIKELLDKKLTEISGGERQTVAVCAALAQETEIIILDEPTSALDIKNQYKVLSVIKQIAKEENKTVILSSHNPNHALYLNSNVWFLKDGKLLEQGKAENAVTVENLKSIYGENIAYSKDLPYDEISYR